MVVDGRVEPANIKHKHVLAKKDGIDFTADLPTCKRKVGSPPGSMSSGSRYRRNVNVVLMHNRIPVDDIPNVAGELEKPLSFGRRRLYCLLGLDTMGLSPKQAMKYRLNPGRCGPLDVFVDWR